MNARLLIFVLPALFFACANRESTPNPNNNVQQIQQGELKIPAFDGNQAYQYLTAQTDFGPRNPGSAGHKNCLQYLSLELNKFADTVMLQTFAHPGYNEDVLEMTNIYASFNRKAATRIFLVAHWDTRPRADQDRDLSKREQPILGANDGASGVAVLLEIGRQLKKSLPNIGVDMLLTDGEDYGMEGDLDGYFLGAKYFAFHRPKNFAPVFGILLDMVGDKQLKLMKEPFSQKYAGSIVDLVWSTADKLNITQFSMEVQPAVQDDHLPLNEIGIKTIDLIDFQYPDGSNKYWHTTQDTPDKCSAESLEAVGTVLIHVIYEYTP